MKPTSQLCSKSDPTNRTNMKKILIFSLAYYPDHVGGAEVAIREITKRLNNDFEFDLITLHCGGNDSCKPLEKIGNVNVYRVGSWVGKLSRAFLRKPRSAGNFLFPSKVAYPVLAFFKATSLNRHRDYDIVWSLMAAHAGLAGMIFKTLHPKVRSILTLQEGVSIEDIKRIAKPIWPLFKRIFVKADAIQAISLYLADFAKVIVGEKVSVRIVPNGVDFEFFSRLSVDRGGDGYADLRAQYRFSENDFVLVTTSRLVQKNGLSDVIEALALPDVPAKVKFLVIGQGELENNLKSRVKELNLTDRVVFSGFIDHTKLPRILAECNAFIRPSLSEGFGISFIEAMAAGLPVIATQVGGIADFLVDPSQDKTADGSGSTGLSCLPNSPVSVAKAITQIVDNAELAKRLSSNARQMVKTRYDWNMVAKSMKEVFVGSSIQ